MIYLESTPNGDGTYNHDAVKAAFVSGAKLEIFNIIRERFVPVKPLGDWYECLIYRAGIEAPQNPGIQSLISLQQLVFDKFQSGNNIPVERITLTRAEVNDVFPGFFGEGDK